MKINHEEIHIIEDLLIPLAAIAIAELGDKTQLSVLLLSSKTDKHFQLLAGVMLAFLIVDGVAIFAGSWITTLVPMIYLKIISGSIFILFGLLMLFNSKEEEEAKAKYKNVFLSGFLLIMLTEWGDKTQIAAALFAINFNPILVLIGTISALAVLSTIAVFFGKIISKKIDKKLITKVAAVIFVIMGIAVLII